MPVVPPVPAAEPPAGRTDSLGCTRRHLDDDAQLATDHLVVHRKRCVDTEVGRVETPASDRGVLVGVSLQAGHRRSILRGRHATRHVFGRDAVYLRRFDDDYRADLEGPFDFVLLELGTGFFDAATDERFGAGRCALGTLTAEPDPVLAHLARALLPALQAPAEASRLFVDQMGLVIGTHLAERYGHTKPLPRRRTTGRLSPAQEATAKELLRSRLDADVSVDEVARACGLSRAHFTRAFRETTGLSPHQWLVAQRMAAARGLLRDRALSLAAIATACGFADQSHFTRVFAKAMGTTPGAWRRARA